MHAFAQHPLAGAYLLSGAVIADVLEHGLAPLVTFLVLPVFALANAGITIAGATVDSVGSAVTHGTMLGLVVGKPLGVTAFTWVSVKCSWPLGAIAAPVGSHGAPVGSHGAPVGSHGAPVGSHGAPVGSHAVGLRADALPVAAPAVRLGAVAVPVGPFAAGLGAVYAPARRSLSRPAVDPERVVQVNFQMFPLSKKKEQGS